MAEEETKQEKEKKGPLAYMKRQIDALETRVELLEKTRIAHLEQSATNPSSTSTLASGITPNLTESKHPVPMEYREIVSTILNGNFDVLVEGRTDLPAFEFTIVVPDKYSTASPDQKQMLGGKDIRPKVITYAEGINGVREWSERVFNNFSNEIKAQIVADRSQLQ